MYEKFKKLVSKETVLSKREKLVKNSQFDRLFTCLFTGERHNVTFDIEFVDSYIYLYPLNSMGDFRLEIIKILNSLGIPYILSKKTKHTKYSKEVRYVNYFTLKAKHFKDGK